ncbi:MAG: hypothetical protein K2P85_00460 [Flavobacteriaceae bacterium]|nr:hypothetical protein [Flavobacteriaceae bacterium]
MKIIKINGYQLAIFKVSQNDEMHVTIKSIRETINLADFEENKPISQVLIDQFKGRYNRPPIEQIQKLVTKRYSSQLLIIILK